MKRANTLPERPAPPTFADRVEAIKAFGFTERQARFVVTVMLHSGVCLGRQYCAFAGIDYGAPVANLLQDTPKHAASPRRRSLATTARGCSTSISSRCTPRLAKPTIAFDAR